MIFDFFVSYSSCIQFICIMAFFGAVIWGFSRYDKAQLTHTFPISPRYEVSEIMFMRILHLEKGPPPSHAKPMIVVGFVDPQKKGLKSHTLHCSNGASFFCVMLNNENRLALSDLCQVLDLTE